MPTKVTGEVQLSKASLGYEDVVADFPNAERVWIATYNLPRDDNGRLMQALAGLDSEVEVEIVSSIPNRWETYIVSTARTKAASMIRRYRRILDPAAFDARVRTFFNFTTHAKLVATNNVAYLGSANFSDESANNFEAGIIVRDADQVSALIEAVFVPLRDASVEDLGSGAARLAVALHDLAGTLEGCIDGLDEGFYMEPDWPATSGGPVFVPPRDPPRIVEPALGSCDDADELLERDDWGAQAREHLKQLLAPEVIERLRAVVEADGPLKALLAFRADEYARRILSEQFDIDEDALEVAQQDASDRAEEKLDSLRDAVDEAQVLSIRSALVALRDQVVAARDQIQSRIAIAQGIDNT